MFPELEVTKLDNNLEKHTHKSISSISEENNALEEVVNIPECQNI